MLPQNNSEPANQALEACRRKGRVVVVGSVGMDLQREAMYSKELDFVMSTSYGPGRYDNQYELKGSITRLAMCAGQRTVT